MFLLKLLMKVLLLPIILVLFVLRVLVKIGIELSSIIIGGLMLIVFGCIIYNGDRFQKYFSDFAEGFGIRDMYSGGFYPYPVAETRWAFWARNIYVNR